MASGQIIQVVSQANQWGARNHEVMNRSLCPNVQFGRLGVDGGTPEVMATCKADCGNQCSLIEHGECRFKPRNSTVEKVTLQTYMLGELGTILQQSQAEIVLPVIKQA